MRLRPFLLAAAVLISPLWMGSFAVRAQAQQAGSMPPCNGIYNTVRVSDIKPGMMAKFVAAVAAQKAWYKGAGTMDEITLMQVFDRDSGSVSETQALTSHTVVPGSKRPANDAGYDAFVTMFKESSTVKQEYRTCVVKP